MSDDARCDEVLELEAEIALGIADGEERARALEHASSCPRCRRRLAELSELADELLLLAPAVEPPAGLESDVVERLRREWSPRRRWALPRPARAVAAIAAVLVAVAAALAGMYVAGEDVRHDAALYRNVLQEANGSYFGALPLREPGGRRRGLLFGYAGSPSWMFVLVRGVEGSGRWRVELRTDRGARRGLGSFEVDSGRGSFGRALPVPLREVERVELSEASGPGRLTAVSRRR